MSNSHKDNWRELAELLGLPHDEPAPPAAAPPPAAPVVEPASSLLPAPVAMEDTFVEEEFTSPEPAEAMSHESTMYYDEVTIEESELDTGMSAPGALMEDIDEAAPVEGQTSEGETAESDKPRDEKRGRRRGRRGRRRGRDEAPETAGAPDAPAAAVTTAAAAEPVTTPKRDEESEEERGARRGRGRRRPAPTDVAGAATEDAEVAAETDNDFSQDAWADWNVPSWQELIDGLHRPDR